MSRRKIGRANVTRNEIVSEAVERVLRDTAASDADVRADAAAAAVQSMFNHVVMWTVRCGER